MTRPGFPAFLLVVLAVTLAGSFTPLAPAQNQRSLSDLRRENERLAAELADTRTELAAARQEIQALEQEIDRLRRLLRDAGATEDALEPQRVTIDESQPNASPRALLKALINHYRDATADVNLGASPEDPQRALYLRHLERWSARANREYKQPIEWHVRFVDPDATAIRIGRGYVIRLHAVDPITDVKLGDPFDALLSNTLAGRIENRLQREGLDRVFLLKGVLVPRVGINEDRLAEGPFDNPRFIGPFAEFGMVVDVRTLLPRPEPAEEPATAPDQPPPSGERTDR